jgi:hypothetical protein
MSVCERGWVVVVIGVVVMSMMVPRGVWRG